MTIDYSQFSFDTLADDHAANMLRELKCAIKAAPDDEIEQVRNLKRHLRLFYDAGCFMGANTAVKKAG